MFLVAFIIYALNLIMMIIIIIITTITITTFIIIIINVIIIIIVIIIINVMLVISRIVAWLICVNKLSAFKILPLEILVQLTNYQPI